MKLGEKVSYLKGLMNGLELDESTKEGKVIALMADILSDIAVNIEDLQDQIDEIVEVVDVIDEDLSNIEEDIYGEECCDDECGCDDDDEDGLYEVCCPTCGDTICITEDMLEEGAIKCPGCGELLEFDYGDEDTDEE